MTHQYLAAVREHLEDGIFHDDGTPTCDPSQIKRGRVGMSAFRQKCRKVTHPQQKLRDRDGDLGDTALTSDTLLLAFGRAETRGRTRQCFTDVTTAPVNKVVNMPKMPCQGVNGR
ncbi:hypothetical protein Bbelb_047780 [Branchiostoma belcheri]|nr:hypothetical protein Bbelb_047780 [Branchiostoma belcheri]